LRFLFCSFAIANENEKIAFSPAICMDVCEKHEIKTKHGHMADPVVGGVLWGVLWVVGGGGGGGFWHTNNAQPGATAPTAATHSPSQQM